jgi:hypothetical protein
VDADAESDDEAKERTEQSECAEQQPHQAV